MFPHLKDYFTFSRTERRGSIVFISIILLLIVVLYSFDYLIPQKKTDFSPFEKQIDSFYTARAIAQQEFKDSLNEAYQDKYKGKNYSYNYKKENFKNYYTKGDSKYNSPSLREGAGGRASAEWAWADVIELNSADTTALMQLKGIGKVFASRIIKYRDMLGGFTSKDQLKEVYGVDSVLYQSIQAFISVNPDAIQKININFADVQLMGKHPYLHYDKAKEIINYRKQAGNFERIEDVRNAVFITDEQYKKLKPYLSLK